LNIAVIGGAGFLGYHLVNNLLQKGHRVLVYDNLFAGRRRCDLPWINQVDFVEGDILNSALLHASLRDFSTHVIYHLAAIHYIPYCNERPADAMRVNVEGTLNVVLAARQLPSVTGLVFASSVALYSLSDRTHLETDQPSPSDIYGLTKMLGEQVVRQYAIEGGFNSLCVRLTNLYGPHETNPHVIPTILKQVANGTDQIKLGRLDTYRDFFSVDVCADGLSRLLCLFERGVFL
jgi:UDP-glucose 4-epimerase